jgi:hypothetical protein
LFILSLLKELQLLKAQKRDLTAFPERSVVPGRLGCP